tara:strand:+ start:1080 stop:1868 length:789 start_codon:yes stop_codon:yes gene_type:complete
MAKLIYTQAEKEFRASIQTDEAGAVSVKRINAPKDKQTGAILKDDNGIDIESFSVEINEKMISANSGFNLLSHANPLNPSFRNSSGLRNAWLTISKEFAKEVFGCDVAQLTALPIHTNENQARLFVGMLNPKFHLNGVENRFRVRLMAQFASEFDPSSYEIQHLVGDKGQSATAKKAGAEGRFMMSLNPKTNTVEHIIERGTVQTATVNVDGTLTNSLIQGIPWEHKLLVEYVETTQTTGVPHQLDASTGEIKVASTGIAPL